jgi:putative transposase
MDVSLSSKRVIRGLDNLIAWRVAPQCIRLDNGPEFIAAALADWAEKRGVELKFIEPGKPYQKGNVERLNKSFRQEVLDAYCFGRIKEAQVMAHDWLWMYNNVRPHSALGYKTPVAILDKRWKGFLGAFPTFVPNASKN